MDKCNYICPNVITFNLSGFTARSHINPIQFSIFVSHLHPGSQIHVSYLSQLNLTSIWVLIFVSRLHPGYISPPLRSTHQIASYFHPRIISNAYRFQDVCLTSIQILPQLENCTSVPSQSHVTLSTSQDVHLNTIQVPSQPHSGLEICVSSPPRLPDSRFLFVSVESHPDLGPGICISATSRSHLTSIHVHQIASYFHPSIVSHPYRFQDVSHLHPGPSATGELYLSSILVPYHTIRVSRCASLLNPGPISTPSRSRGLCLISTQAPRFTFLLSQLNLTSIWVLIFASRLHPGNISPPPRSTKLHLISTQASSQMHTGLTMCVSSPSKSFLHWRILFQFHPSPIYML